jgi:hypothetical protein
MKALLVTVVLLLLVGGFLQAENPKLEFWNDQRKGANGGADEASDEWFAAAARVGIEFARLSPANMKSSSRDFLLGDADRFAGIPQQDYEQLERVLDTAQRHNVKVVLTMFSLPGARWRQHNDSKFDYRLWTDELYHHQAAAFWKALAGRLREHPAVIGYNPINEPHPERKSGFEPGNTEGFGKWLQESRGTPADLDGFYRRIVSSIREADKNTPIILDSRFHAHPEGFRFFEPMDDEAVLYSFHFYDPWNFTTFRVNKDRFSYPAEMPKGWSGETTPWTHVDLKERLEPVLTWAKRHQIPPNRIMAGEFGCDRRVRGVKNYLTDLIRLFNEQNWHWAFYSFRSADWDGMDYELGTDRLGWKYWQAREEGMAHEALIHRDDNPLWSVFRSQFQKR